MAVNSERSSNSCHVIEETVIGNAGNQCKNEELMNSKHKCTRPAHLYNILTAALAVTSAFALVLAATALSKNIPSKEVEDPKPKMEQLNEAEDPTIASLSCFERYGWSIHGDLYYKLFTDVRVDYDTAATKCSDHGGRLAAELLRRLDISDMTAKSLTNSSPWIGFDDIAREGVWKWSDDGHSNTNTTGWIAGAHQGNGNNLKDCGYIVNELANGSKLQLHDSRCSTRRYYVCEIDKDNSEVNREH